MNKLILIIASLFLLNGCIAPRLGLETVRYDNAEREQTPETTFITIFSSQEDIDYEYSVIAEVIASPMKAERDFGHDPIELLREQARAIGGTGLTDVKSGSEHDSRHVWRAKVIAPKILM